MFSDDEDDKTIYNVVVNHEEQYSIWPVDREVPPGWASTGKSGLKQDCLDFVREVWTDMRPLSLRKHMDELRTQGSQADHLSQPAEAEDWNQGPTLVERLCEGRHRVLASLRPVPTVQAFKECIERGYVHIQFTDTRGGTELGVRLDKKACDDRQANFESRVGEVHLEGDLTLDYVRVRCIADIDLNTLTGQGHLNLAESL